MYLETTVIRNWHTGPPRGLGGPRVNAKSGVLQCGLCEGFWGYAPSRFYMHALNFWDLLRLFSCMHTVHIYLQVAVFDYQFKYDVQP